MVIANFYKRLKQLKDLGVEIEQVLDIGAYRGDFTETVKSVWPKARIQQFEADERQKQYLNADAKIALLGDEEKEVKFYTIEDTNYGVTTGSSIYKERTDYYKNPIVTKKNMVTLDSVLDASGDWSKGLVKIDTQGSELDILHGAKNFLNNQKPLYILLECSIQQYNENSPLIGDVVSEMAKLGYEMNDVVDLSYDQQGRLLQTDILFKVKK